MASVEKITEMSASLKPYQLEELIEALEEILDEKRQDEFETGADGDDE